MAEIKIFGRAAVVDDCKSYTVTKRNRGKKVKEGKTMTSG